MMSIGEKGGILFIAFLVVFTAVFLLLLILSNLEEKGVDKIYKQVK